VAQLNSLENSLVNQPTDCCTSPIEKAGQRERRRESGCDRVLYLFVAARRPVRGRRTVLDAERASATGSICKVRARGSSYVPQQHLSMNSLYNAASFQRSREDMSSRRIATPLGSRRDRRLAQHIVQFADSET
jgi:hypothetical protein